MTGFRGVKRHPLCPSCEYDLVATVAANCRTCPECGYQFDMNELRRERLADDWTPVKGLLRVARILLVRAVIVLPFWAGVIWLLSPVINIFPMSARTIGAIAILLAIPGVALGHALGRRLTEAAGMQSMLVLVMGVVFAIAVVVAGVQLAVILRPMPVWTGFVCSATSCWAAVWIGRNVYLDD